jgi:hypothetical protein
MESKCVNPYCDCKPCHCEPPCTCGLTYVRRATEEVWDAGAHELRFVTTDIFRRALRRTPERSVDTTHDTSHAEDPGYQGAPAAMEQQGDPQAALEASLSASEHRQNAMGHYTPRYGS